MFREDEKLCLKWNDFQENVISAFRTIREDKEFVDVTLVCEDGQQVEAHKIILTSSSPFFLNLLRKNKHPHPLIYMRGMKSEDLIALMDFLYFGETNVYQERIDTFLAVAEELQLKGLMGSPAQNEPEYSNVVPPFKSEQPKTNKARKRNNHSKRETTPDETDDNVYVYEPQGPIEGTVAVTDYTVAVDLQDLDDKIKSMIGLSENKIGSGARANELAKICKVCGKEGTMGHIKTHIEAKHITGVSHTCDICGASSKSRNALGMHKLNNHKSSVPLFV